MFRSSAISLYKNELIDIYNHAIEAVKPDHLIKNAINIKDNRLTVRDRINGSEINLDIEKSNLHLIGGGKSVMSMACGMARLAKQAGVEHRFSFGCLSLPIGFESTLKDDVLVRNQLNSIGVRCLFGSKDNLPDEDSVQASKTILEEIKIACDKDCENSRQPLFIVLISGGGSACLTSPKFIDLKEKLQLIKFLVQKGASIVELNKVRRYFSNIKGGELARHILRSHPKSRVVTLILSDVIGDPVEYIASGPTYLSRDTESSIHEQSMLSILRKYEYSDDNLRSYKNSRNKPDETYDYRELYNVVIGNNAIALDSAINRAQSLNYQVKLLGNRLEGFSDEIVERILVQSEQTFSSIRGRVLVIGGGEVTINKQDNETWGRGGRAQEMAIDYMISRLSSSKTKEQTRASHATDIFMAGSTDGQDGPTDVAGCMASLADLKSSNLDLLSFEQKLLEAKRGHDSYNFWTRNKPDWLVKTGLTGTNVMDLYMYLLCSE